MEQSQFDLTQQLKVLWQFKWRIILIALIAGVTALILTSLRPQVYSATARLMAGNGQQRLAAIPSGIQGGIEMTYLQDVGSQIEVMKSHDVLEQAVLQIYPELADNPDALQMEVVKLESSLSIEQVDSTNLVTITVFSTNPNLAQRQADSVAQAYVNQVQTMTKASIENALQDTTNRLEELQKANVDLSISPVLPRITTQVNTGLSALKSASEQLRQMEKSGPEMTGTGDADTLLTESQLDTISRRIKANTLEATELASLAGALLPVSEEEEEEDYIERSSAIADIESRTRALTTKLGSLYTEVSTTRQAETNPEIKDQLLALEEQLQVAGSASQAVLGQVITLYGIQEQYIAGPNTEGNQARDLAKEADANVLHRIIKHTTVLTGTLDAATAQVDDIVPITGSATWQFAAMGNRADSAAGILDEINQKIQPNSSEGNIFLTRSELSMMEIQAQTISLNLASLSSELTELQSDESNSQIVAGLLNIQESISIASNATRVLGEEISGLTANGGDVTSYTALDNLRQELQLALLSKDTTGTRVVDAAVISSTGNIFSRYRGVLLAVIAGLLLGAVIILVLRYFDHTVRDASQVKSQTGLPLMANIINTKGNNPHAQSVLDEEANEYLETYRFLRTNLGLDHSEGKVLLVSSPEAEEGKTSVAANLARVVALQGRKVLLIDGNLHYPGIADTFGLEGEMGLTELLSGVEDEKVQHYEAEGIHILTSGKPSVVSAELLSSPRLKQLLERARKDYDVIIVDSAPITEWTDTRILARNVDGVLMVLQSNKSRLDLVKESKQALDSVGVRTEGFVLNTAG